MLPEVTKALADHPIEPCDLAVAELAKTYARQIDNGGDLDKLGPRLLACLEALQMTPRARAAGRKAAPDGQPGKHPLDELAEQRARRGRPPALDSGTS